MKKILILLIILFMVSSCSSTLEKRSLEEVEPDSLVDDATVVSSAVEKRSLKEVEPNSLVHDAKVVFPEAGDDHMAFGLWMPTEFWLNVFARDKTTSEHDKKAMLDAVSGISLLFLVQADLSPLGVPLFYSKEKIKEHLSVVARDSSGNSRNVTLLSELSPDLEMLINVLKAYTATFIGSMGNSMQFFVLQDPVANSNRLLDPYNEAVIEIEVMRKDQTRLVGKVELPLNSLFVPRKCPNGKDAHISWDYCPWSGKRLEE